MEIDSETANDGTGTYIEVLFDNGKKNSYEFERDGFTFAAPEEMIKDLGK